MQIRSGDLRKVADSQTDRQTNNDEDITSFAEVTNCYGLEAAWRSDDIVGRINEATLRRARLVLRWVTVFGGKKPPQYFTKTSRPTQTPTLSGTGNEYQKCGDALRLGSKGRYGSFQLWINV